MAKTEKEVWYIHLKHSKYTIQYLKCFYMKSKKWKNWAECGGTSLQSQDIGGKLVPVQFSMGYIARLYLKRRS